MRKSARRIRTQSPVKGLVHSEVEIFDEDPIQKGVDALETSATFDEESISLHLNAALFHDSAAYHHRRAARLLLEGRDSQAQRHMNIANARSQRAHVLSQQRNRTAAESARLPLASNPNSDSTLEINDIDGTTVITEKSADARIEPPELRSEQNRRGNKPAGNSAAIEDDEGLEFDGHATPK